MITGGGGEERKRGKLCQRREEVFTLRNQGEEICARVLLASSLLPLHPLRVNYRRFSNLERRSRGGQVGKREIFNPNLEKIIVI